MTSAPTPGARLDASFIARIPDARMIYVDPRIASGMSDEVLKAVDAAQDRGRSCVCGSDGGQRLETMAMGDATGTLCSR
jgi:hypothetical protein